MTILNILILVPLGFLVFGEMLLSLSSGTICFFSLDFDLDFDTEGPEVGVIFLNLGVDLWSPYLSWYGTRSFELEFFLSLNYFF